MPLQVSLFTVNGTKRDDVTVAKQITQRLSEFHSMLLILNLLPQIICYLCFWAIPTGIPISGPQPALIQISVTQLPHIRARGSYRKKPRACAVEACKSCRYITLAVGSAPCTLDKKLPVLLLGYVLSWLPRPDLLDVLLLELA